MKSSKSVTFLLQHPQPFKPSWNTGPFFFLIIIIKANNANIYKFYT